MGVFLAAGLLIGPVLTASAHTVTLSHLNSIVEIDPHSQSGMSRWSVDGVDHLFQQWFWFRVGSSAESSIDTLALVTEEPFSIPMSGPLRGLALVYTGPGFTLEVTYQLTGGSLGSKSSDIAESIGIYNDSASPLEIHFFQYTDLDLNGTAGNDVAVRTNDNTIRQTEPGVTFNETIVTPPPSHFEIAAYPTILGKLNDASPTTLTDLTSPLGPGDVSWAWQWDTVLAPSGQPGSDLLISKDKLITYAVAEPGALILLGAGLFGMACVGSLGRWRR
jgi:hypothetical protein